MRQTRGHCIRAARKWKKYPSPMASSLLLQSLFSAQTIKDDAQRRWATSPQPEKFKEFLPLPRYQLLTKNFPADQSPVRTSDTHSGARHTENPSAAPAKCPSSNLRCACNAIEHLSAMTAAPKPGMTGTSGLRMTRATPATCRSVTLGTSRVCSPPAGSSMAMAMFASPAHLNATCHKATPDQSHLYHEFPRQGKSSWSSRVTHWLNPPH